MKEKAILIVRSASWLLAVVAVVALSAAIAQAGKPNHLTHGLKSLKDAEEVAAGSTVAMSCSKCQTVLVIDADEEKTFLDWFKPDKKHLCPGCKGEFEHVGPKGKKGGTIHVHSCSMCGDASMFCCATTGAPAKGTDKKN